MSFNLGNNDRLPAFGSNIPSNSKNPLQEATNPSNNRGADMILTPDHPSWHAVSDQHDPSHAQRTSTGPTAAGSGAQGGMHVDPSASYTGGRVTAGSENRGPFRAGPDSDSYLPPGAVPQGARFDPIMPEDVRQGLPNRGQGQFPRGPAAHGSGEPDYDELLPPR